MGYHLLLLCFAGGDAGAGKGESPPVNLCQSWERVLALLRSAPKSYPQGMVMYSVTTYVIQGGHVLMVSMDL